ncbi:unnamed protein product [Heterobilharzia americana]|nr:unnamed protein product [Heterobilharzia americana]
MTRKIHEGSMITVDNWKMMICKSVWITVLIISHGQCDSDSNKPVKLVIGPMVEMDFWSLYRLPNQSAVCDQFINSFYLDDPKEDRRSLSLSGSLSPSPTTAAASVAVAATSSSASSASSASSTANAQLWDRHKPTSWINAVEFDHIGLSGLMQLPKPDRQHPFDYNKRLKSALRSRQPTLFTFTSPLYPDNYPPNTDCVKVIKAPQEDQQIILDFRGPFHFEPSADCINDYLEVRDGEYGFSPLIGRFCSDSRQLHAIKSTGRWLRLRYHSDFSIEKSGFQAVYYFSKLRNKDEPLPQKPIVTTSIIVDDEVIFEQSNLLTLWNDYTESLIRVKSHPVDRLTEFIIDFRTNQTDLILMIHLSFLKFQIIDPECKANIIELYDEFFLSEQNTFLRTPSILLKRSKGQIPVNEQYTPRVIQACNRPNLEPYIHKLGRGVVRIIVSPESRSTEASEYMHTNTSNTVTELPEIKIIATVLKKALCEGDWVPCILPTNYIAYKEYFNLTIRSKSTYEEVDDDENDGNSGKSDKSHSRLSELQISTTTTPPPPTTMTKASTIFSTTKNSVASMKSTVLQRHPTVPKIIYCVQPSLVCNGHSNCPGGEDEENQGYSDQYSPKKMFIQTTEGVITTEKAESISSSSSSSSEDDDEFHHHTPIIAGLLGFCAICGLISAGMTLVNRSKKQNHPNFGSVCNSILFESGTSLITALESVVTCSTPVYTTTLTPATNVTDTLKNEDIKPLKTSSNCTFLNCSNSCLNSETKLEGTLVEQTEVVDDDDDDDDGDGDVVRQEQGQQTADIKHDVLKSTTSGLAEIFDRATKPLGYIHKLDSSPAWNQSVNQSSLYHLKETQKSRPLCSQYLYEYPINRSLVQLPNTLVIPVDKLSKQFNSPTIRQKPTQQSYFESNVSRSDPFSLKEQSKFKTTTGFSKGGEHLQFGNLRRSFSVRPVNDNSSTFTPHVSSNSLKEATLPSRMLRAHLVNDDNDRKSCSYPCHSVEQRCTPDKNVFSIIGAQGSGQQFSVKSQAWRREQKRKHFKGSAPKRAKHENGFVLQEQSQPQTPLHQLLCLNQQDKPQYTQQTKSSAHLELFTLYKSSQSTSGELLDKENYKSCHYKRDGKEIKRFLPPMTTVTKYSIKQFNLQSSPLKTTTNWLVSPNSVQWNRQSDVHNGQNDGSSVSVSQNDSDTPSETDCQHQIALGADSRRRVSNAGVRMVTTVMTTTATMTATTAPPKRMRYQQMGCNTIDQESDSQEISHNNNDNNDNIFSPTHSLITGTTTIFDDLQIFKHSNETYQCNCNLGSTKYTFPSSYSVIPQTLLLSSSNKIGDGMRKNASWSDMSHKVEHLFQQDNDDDDDEGDYDDDDYDVDDQINENSGQSSSEVDSSSADRIPDQHELKNAHNNHLPNPTLSADSSSEESLCRMHTIGNHSIPKRQSLGTSVVIITSKGRTVQSPTNII